MGSFRVDCPEQRLKAGVALEAQASEQVEFVELVLVSGGPVVLQSRPDLEGVDLVELRGTGPLGLEEVVG